MSRVQAVEFHESGIIYVTLAKTVQGHLIGSHRVPLEPGADIAKIVELVNAEFRNQKFEEIDDTWHKIIPPILQAVHTRDVVHAYAAKQAARIAALNPKAETAPAPKGQRK